jgi:hypothetical protein
VTPRPLDVEVVRKGRPEARFQVTADADDYPVLRETLRGWLTGHGWSEGRWAEFELKVRFAGEHKVRTIVRAV